MSRLRAEELRTDDGQLTAVQPPQGVPAELDAGTSNQPGEEGKRKNPVARFFGVLGPGLVTVAADDDPSGIATYSQAGATYGNSMLWTVPLTLPLMMAVQEICDRMALSSGDSLGMLIRRKFSRGFRLAIVSCFCVFPVVDLKLDTLHSVVHDGQSSARAVAGHHSACEQNSPGACGFDAGHGLAPDYLGALPIVALPLQFCGSDIRRRIVGGSEVAVPP